MALTGLDISRYQDTTPALANYSFMFARATYGMLKDSRYDTHMAKARAVGIVAGAYHFGYSDKVASSESQARWFLGVAKDADLIALDLESSNYPMTVADAREFIAEVHRLGRRIGLYHSASGFPDCGQDWDWIAAWDVSTFPAGAEFWQYRGSPLDLDKFRGDLPALKALVAASHMESNLGLQLTQTTASPGPVAGVLTVPAGTRFLRVSDGVEGKTVTKFVRTATTISALGGSGGFIVNLDNGELGFIYNGWLPAGSFEANETLTQADVDKAVAKATSGLFTQAQVDTVVKSAINADRAKATVGVVYPD